MVEWWHFGGRGSSWVDLDQHKWDSDPRGLMGMDLGSDWHKWDSENGFVLVFYFYFYFYLFIFFWVCGYGFGSGGC